MQESNRLIKIITPGMCPHCNKEILFSQKMVTPNIDWVLRPEDCEMAKKKVIDEVLKANIDESEKQLALNWVKSPDTLFGPDDVKNILSQIIKEKKEDKPVEEKSDNKENK